MIYWLINYKVDTGVTVESHFAIVRASESSKAVEIFRQEVDLGYDETVCDISVRDVKTVDFIC